MKKYILYLFVLMCVIQGCKKAETIDDTPKNTFGLIGTWKSLVKINASYNQDSETEYITSTEDWKNVITLQVSQVGTDTLVNVSASKDVYPGLCILGNTPPDFANSGSVHYDTTSHWFYFWNGTYSTYTSNDTLALQCGYGGGGGGPITRVRVYFKKQ